MTEKVEAPVTISLVELPGSAISRKVNPKLIKNTESSNPKLQVNPNIINKVTAISKAHGDHQSVTITAQALDTSDNNNGDANDCDTSQQFYIEVDATTAASLKAGTQFTLIPMGEENSAVTYTEDNANMTVHVTASTDNVKEVNFIQPKVEDDVCDDTSGPLVPKALPVKDVDSSSHMDVDASGGAELSIQTKDETQQYSQMPQSSQSNPQESNVKVTTYSPLTPTPHMQQFVPMHAPPPRFHPHPPVTASPTVQQQFPLTPYPSHHYFYNHAPPGNPSSHSTPLPGLTAHSGTPVPVGRGMSVRSSGPGQASSWSPYPQGFHGQPYFRGGNSISNSSSESPVILNSSGEEQTSGSPDSYPKTPQNTPISAETSGSGPVRLTPVTHFSHASGPLDNPQYYIPLNGRETHNEKERKRRSRIKASCDTLRALIPGLSDKTDKATVFEYTVQYLFHLRRNVGMKYDKEFIEKYSPY